MSVLVEACCGSVDDAVAAARGGADRIELNSGLFLGGLTPSLGETMVVLDRVHVPVIAMIRPREAGFCYTRYEYETMCCDACALVDAGVAGICFAILTADGRVDVERCDTLMRMVRRVNKKCEFVFSRAIDVVPDLSEAIEDLVELGFSRVLTSGQAASAAEGADAIARMRELAAGRLSVVAAGGIDASNVVDLIGRTGVDQVHGSFSTDTRDESCAGAGGLYFGGTVAGARRDETTYRTCDEARVMDVLRAVGRGAEVDEMVATGV
jgi:copper homeostasis protein